MFPLDAVASGAIVVDGLVRDWKTPMTALGSPSDASVGFATDGATLFIAAKVADPDVHPGRDVVRIELSAGRIVRNITLSPGLAGRARAVLHIDGKPSKLAQVVEAVSPTGFAIEASIPWSALGLSPPGLRVRLSVHDEDVGGKSSDLHSAPPGQQSPLATAVEMGGMNLIRKRTKTFSCEGSANLHGDGRAERFIGGAGLLAVFGPQIRDGKEYYYRDHGKDVRVSRCETEDLTGDGRQELLTWLVLSGPAGDVTQLEVLAFDTGAVPTPLVRTDVAWRSASGSLSSEVSWKPGELTVTRALAVGTPPSAAPVASGGEPLWGPWEMEPRRRWTGKGGALTANGPAPSGPPTSTPLAPPGVIPKDAAFRALVERLGITDPVVRFEQMADVLGKRDRVLLVGPTLAVISEQGALGQFVHFQIPFVKEAEQVERISTLDLDGDGKAEIVAETRISRAGPGGASLEQRVVWVLSARDGSLHTRLGVEVARRLGERDATAAFRVAKNLGGIEARPAKVTGWSKETFPFPPKNSLLSGVEPLLMPWESSAPVLRRLKSGT